MIYPETRVPTPVHELLEKWPHVEPKTPSQWDSFFGWKLPFDCERAVAEGLVCLEADGTITPAQLAMLSLNRPEGKNGAPYCYQRLTYGGDDPEALEPPWAAPIPPRLPEHLTPEMIATFYAASRKEANGLDRDTAREVLIETADARVRFGRYLMCMHDASKQFSILDGIIGRQQAALDLPDAKKRFAFDGVSFVWWNSESAHARLTALRWAQVARLRRLTEALTGHPLSRWPSHSSAAYGARIVLDDARTWPPVNAALMTRVAEVEALLEEYERNPIEAEPEPKAKAKAAAKT